MFEGVGWREVETLSDTERQQHHFISLLGSLNVAKNGNLYKVLKSREDILFVYMLEHQGLGWMVFAIDADQTCMDNNRSFSRVVWPGIE